MSLNRNHTGALALVISLVTLASVALGMGTDLFKAGRSSISRKEVEEMVDKAEKRREPIDNEFRQRLIRIENVVLDMRNNGSRDYHETRRQ